MMLLGYSKKDTKTRDEECGETRVDDIFALNEKGKASNKVYMTRRLKALNTQKNGFSLSELE